MREQAEVFLHQAEQCDGRSPLYAQICRELAEEPLVAAIEPEPRWDLPLRLLGGLHFLQLAEGIDPWSNVRGVLAERRAWLARFVPEQGVQTNEVRRSWGLVPVFLLVAAEVGRPLDLVELGPSAGLNLVWDRYRYRYGDASWGPADAPLELDGELRRPFPPELLSVAVEVRRRRGIDLNPIDVTTEEGARLLECFVWADQAERIDRLRRAIEALRAAPPELIAGDYVDLLPGALADRDPEAMTVVFQTASLGYLSHERRTQLLAEIEQAGSEAPLAFLTAAFDEELEGCWPLEVTVWPGGETRRLAHQDFHGAWLEWLL